MQSIIDRMIMRAPKTRREALEKGIKLIFCIQCKGAGCDWCHWAGTIPEEWGKIPHRKGDANMKPDILSSKGRRPLWWFAEQQDLESVKKIVKENYANNPRINKTEMFLVRVIENLEETLRTVRAMPHKR